MRKFPHSGSGKKEYKMRGALLEAKKGKEEESSDDQSAKDLSIA